MADRFGAFTASLRDGQAPPASADAALEALWWGAKGNWERAHGIVAEREGERNCDRVHAWLHRVEGDDANARYWYRRAGLPAATGTTDAEWREIVTALLA
ncbi:MAG: hypothetical protein INR65_13340 [Gluconacetobacter diazotrophicus]|nr:hypothetical protein [Gluconacetobacter diazotrophicus]